MSDLREQLQSSLGAAFRLERELGGGGMSRVFVARETALNRDVVVKVLAPELAEGISVERFTREIQLAAALQEPHIVPLLATGTTTGGLPYYTMPFVSGESLRLRMGRGPLLQAESVGILRDVLRALAYAHGQGIVHRDIKPENVLLSSGTAVVTDFGIAKAISASRTQAPGGTLTVVGTSLGTPAYMAPEQAAGDPTVDARVDIYAWGMMAYELLAGRHPFAERRTPQQLMTAQMSEVPPALAAVAPGVSAAVARLVMQALEKDPVRRPASAGHMIAVLDQVAPSGDYSTTQPGTRRWLIGAGIATAVAVALIVFAARRRFEPPPGAATAPGRSVVVMPLANVGGDTLNAYFADGLTDELTSAIAKLPGIRVVSGASAAMWKGKAAVDLHDVGSRLHVDEVLEGSVRRAGLRLRIVAKLSNTSDGRIVWTEPYEEDAGDVFAVQASIARSVATALRVPLGVVDSTRLARAGTQDTIAHELFLRARFLHMQYGEANLRRAIALYGKATERDPRYAEAWSAAGLAWFNLADEYVAPRVAEPHLAEAARHALAVDSTSGDARILLANSERGHLPMREVAAHAAAAAAAAPNSMSAQIMGGMLVTSVDPVAGAALTGRARDLDPLSGIAAGVQGFALMYANRLPAAERAARDGVALSPDVGLTHAILGEVLLRENRPAEALSSFEKGIAAGDRDNSYMGAGMALTKLGRIDEARRYRKKLEDDSRTRYVIGDWAARLCLALGDTSAALTWLERAAAAGSNYTILIDVDPDFAPLRGNPRFEAIRRKVGLTNFR